MSRHIHKDLITICKAAETQFPGKYKIFKLTCQPTGETFVGCTTDVYRYVSSLHRVATRYRGQYLIHRMIREFSGQFDLEIVDSDDDQHFARDVLVPSFISLFDSHHNGLNETPYGSKRVKAKHSPKTKQLLRLIAIREGRCPGKMRGYKWYNDGSKNKQVFPGQVPPEGFRPGRIYHER
jgi:hypothetical protein